MKNRLATHLITGGTHRSARAVGHQQNAMALRWFRVRRAQSDAPYQRSFTRWLPAFVAALLFATCTWSAEKSPAPPAPAKRIGLEEFDRLRAANTNIVILDVRSAAEFEKGRIGGATNIDFNSLRFEEKVRVLDKARIYVVTCAVGVRSARACKKLELLGFHELYDLAPGFDGWKKAFRPIEK